MHGVYGLLCLFCCLLIDIKENVKKGENLRLKNMKIDANGTEIRVMGNVVNEDAE